MTENNSERVRGDSEYIFEKKVKSNSQYKQPKVSLSQKLRVAFWRCIAWFTKKKNYIPLCAGILVVGVGIGIYNLNMANKAVVPDVGGDDPTGSVLIGEEKEALITESNRAIVNGDTAIMQVLIEDIDKTFTNDYADAKENGLYMIKLGLMLESDNENYLTYWNELVNHMNKVDKYDMYQSLALYYERKGDKEKQISTLYEALYGLESGDLASLWADNDEIGNVKRKLKSLGEKIDIEDVVDNSKVYGEVVE